MDTDEIFAKYLDKFHLTMAMDLSLPDEGPAATQETDETLQLKMATELPQVYAPDTESSGDMLRSRENYQERLRKEAEIKQMLRPFPEIWDRLQEVFPFTQEPDPQLSEEAGWEPGAGADAGAFTGGRVDVAGLGDMQLSPEAFKPIVKPKKTGDERIGDVISDAWQKLKHGTVGLPHQLAEIATLLTAVSAPPEVMAQNMAPEEIAEMRTQLMDIAEGIGKQRKELLGPDPYDKAEGVSGFAKELATDPSIYLGGLIAKNAKAAARGLGKILSKGNIERGPQPKARQEARLEQTAAPYTALGKTGVKAGMRKTENLFGSQVKSKPTTISPAIVEKINLLNALEDFTENIRKTRPNSRFESEYYNNAMPDTDRGVARYITAHLDDLPEDLLYKLNDEVVMDRETGEFLNAFQDGLRGGHIGQLRRLRDQTLDSFNIDDIISFNAGGVANELPSAAPTAAVRTLDDNTLAALRKQATGLEDAARGVTLYVTHDGKAIVSKPKGVKTPARLKAFASKHGLEYSENQWRRPVTKDAPLHSEPMPAEYRESGAKYAWE